MSYNPNNPNGQTLGINSAPMVWASDVGLPIGTNNIGSVKLPDVATAGSLAALNATITTAVNSQGIVAIQLTGTWAGTISFQGTEDPTGIAAPSTSWFNINGVASVTGAQVTSTTSNGQFRVNSGGYTAVRVLMTVFGSGSATVWINASIAPSMATLAEPLPTGANTIGAVTNTNLDVALSTRLKPTDTLTAVALNSDIRQLVPANLNATVLQQLITKGTQGANGVTTQDLKDAGRNQVHYYTLIPVLTSATDTLQILTGTKAGTTVTATATPAVVTTAKTFRVTRMAATYIATATSGYGIVRLRFQSAGVATITSPIAATLLVGAGAPTTANSTASEEATLDEGWEFAAGVGVGISVQGFAAVTPTAVGYVLVSLTGYEY